MNAPTSHIIRRQYLHIEINGSESEGMALQRSLSGLCQHYLMPALERVMDRYAPIDGHLTIERLEIDAGILMRERLEHDLADIVTKTIEEFLREQSQSSGKTIFKTNSSNVQRKTVQQSIQEAFIYFLKTGCLPWSFSLPTDKTLEQVIFDSWLKKEKSPAIFRSINTTIVPTLASETARKRLICQFSPIFLNALLSALSSESKQAMDRALKILRDSNVSSIDAKFFERQLWETAFATIAAGNSLTEIKLVSETWHSLSVPSKQLSALARLLEKHWPGTTERTSKDHLKNAKTVKPDSLISEERHGVIDEKFERIKGFNKDSAKKNKFVEQLPSKTHIVKKKLSEIAEKSEVPEISQSNIEAHSGIDIKEGFYVICAGLVLLHPFLPRFFEALGITTKDQLIYPDRALCLLHFLATGQSFAPEYELILPKILCNIPLETPVESIMELSPAELEEATALLEAAIRHWEALRNTSIDGLRGTFLVRPGKVSMCDDGNWLLQVESKSYDILLDQLPPGWGIGMIKLPWMQQMLRVEWNS